jgi:hypothetical protein
MEKCRNCDAPLKEGRYCPECGADSKAKKFSNTEDLLAENNRLKTELEKKKNWIAPPEGKNVEDDI